MSVDEKLLFALLVAIVLVGAALMYLAVALVDYLQHGDARAFRGWVGAMLAFFGMLALVPSQSIRDATPQLEPFWRALIVVGVIGFVIGVLFSAVVGAWSLWRGRRIE